MQHQKTAPKKTDFSALDLSPEEQAFAEELALSGNQSEAYRKAYGATGYSSAALHVQACRKAADPRIREYVAALRSAGAARASLSLQARIDWEIAFAERCEQSGNMGAAGAASDRINKLMGLYVEQFKDVGKDDPLQALKDIAKHSPEIASQLAKEHGIQWQSDEPPTSTH